MKKFKLNKPIKTKNFLIAEDEAFRPVNLSNGPDGAMYVVDYHNGIIQHKVYMTAYLRDLYLERGLDTIIDYGRILKISQKKEPVITFHINQIRNWSVCLVIRMAGFEIGRNRF